MARKSTSNSDGETISGYFRKVYAEHPEWLKKRSNAPALERWLDDHEGYAQVPDQVKTNLANIKSILRKKKGKRGAKKAAAIEALDGAKPVLPRASIKGLEALEEYIDEGLSLAKNIDRSVLKDIIDLLREARNKVVLMTNQ